VNAAEDGPSMSDGSTTTGSSSAFSRFKAFVFVGVDGRFPDCKQQRIHVMIVGRVARFFKSKHPPNWENYTNWHKLYQTAINYTKWL
jgi:hypothetical protein